jgi:hypothetical protein
MMAKARAEGKRSARKQKPNPQPPPAQAPASDVTDAIAALTEAVGEIKSQMTTQQTQAAEATFDAAFKAHAIPDSVRPFMLDSYRAQKPANALEWMATAAKALGATAAATPAKEQERATPGAIPTPGQRDPETVNIAELTAEDVRRLQSEGRFHQVLERARLQGNNGVAMPFSKRPLPK